MGIGWVWMVGIVWVWGMCGLVGWMDRVGFVLCEVWWSSGVGGAGWMSSEEAGDGDSVLLEVSL